MGDLRPPSGDVEEAAEAAEAAAALGRYVVRGAYRLSLDRVVVPPPLVGMIVSAALDLRLRVKDEAVDGLGLGLLLRLQPPPPLPLLLRLGKLMVGDGGEWRIGE